MLASEKMRRRAALFALLTQIDDDLKAGMAEGFGMASMRAAAEARKLLTDRRAVCDEMLTVGYQPWGIPVVIEEEKAI